jgi:hypothetical protein
LTVTDRVAENQASEWDWIEEGDLEILGSLTFARGASPEDVITAYGMDPAGTQLLPAARAHEALLFPVLNDELDVIHPWIRAGKAGEWAFAIDDGSVGMPSYQQEVVLALSRGTDAAWFSWNPKIDYFHYFVDGTEVTAFEPLLAEWRRGSDPDRFLAQMRQAGLDPDPLRDGASPRPVTRSPRICLLEMLTLALGIRLPREVALGPLLTVQRG